MKLKKIIAGALSCAITLTAVPLGSVIPQFAAVLNSYTVSAAETFTFGAFTYTFDKDENAVISKYDGSLGKILKA